MSVTLLTLLPHSRSTSYRHQGACPPFALSQCSCAPSRLTLTCESKRVTGESMSENEIFVGSGYLLASGHVSMMVALSEPLCEFGVRLL